MKKNFPLKQSVLILAFLTLLLVATSCDILLEDTGRDPGSLEASGVVEAIEVVIAPEVGGRIAKVLVSEGQQVMAGDILFEIEDKLLISQLNQAEA